MKRPRKSLRNVNRRTVCKYASVMIRDIIIHQIFSLARDWSKRVTWTNIPQLKLGNILGYNPSINFHVILNLKSPDSYHAITPAGVDICPLIVFVEEKQSCLLYTSPSPRDQRGTRMPSTA